LPRSAAFAVVRADDQAHFVDTALRATICKTRYVAGGQQVARTDDESHRAVDPEEEDGLIAAIAEVAPTAGAIVLSDYGKGVASDRGDFRANLACRRPGIEFAWEPFHLGRAPRAPPTFENSTPAG